MHQRSLKPSKSHQPTTIRHVKQSQLHTKLSKLKSNLNSNHNKKLQPQPKVSSHLSLITFSPHYSYQPLRQFATKRTTTAPSSTNTTSTTKRNSKKSELNTSFNYDDDDDDDDDDVDNDIESGMLQFAQDDDLIHSKSSKKSTTTTKGKTTKKLSIKETRAASIEITTPPRSSSAKTSTPLSATSQTVTTTKQKKSPRPVFTDDLNIDISTELGSAIDFSTSHLSRNGIPLDIVKRKLFPLVTNEGILPLELTRDEFQRRQPFIASEDLPKTLENVLTTEDVAVLSMSRAKLSTKRQFDLTRGSPYCEHIRHIFPVHDFSGGIPPFTDAEIQALFNRRPRFLNFVTENNPHGFDLPFLHRLASEPNMIKRNKQINKQIAHRYWHLRASKPIKVQPKISHRMHVHRTLNPRSNTFKHHYLKSRTVLTKQQKTLEKQNQVIRDANSLFDHGMSLEDLQDLEPNGNMRDDDDDDNNNDDFDDDNNNDDFDDDNNNIPKSKSKKSTAKIKKISTKSLSNHSDNELQLPKLSELLIDVDEELYTQVRWSQRDIEAKLRKAGLSPEQVLEAKRFSTTYGEDFLNALVHKVGGTDEIDPTLRTIQAVRESQTREALSQRRQRLSAVIDDFLVNLDDPARFSKVVIAAEKNEGKSIVKPPMRKQLLDDVQRSGGLHDLKDHKVVQIDNLLRQSMFKPKKLRLTPNMNHKLIPTVAKAKIKRKSKRQIEEDELLL